MKLNITYVVGLLGAIAVFLFGCVAKVVTVPVTVKCRLGWDKGSINVLDFTKRMEDCGASLITVHGRTRSQLYSGTADYHFRTGILSVVARYHRLISDYRSNTF